MNTHCRVTSCPPSSSSTLLQCLGPNMKQTDPERSGSTFVNWWKVWQKDTEAFDTVRKNKSRVLLCGACSVFCTMKRWMTGYSFCTHETMRSGLSVTTCNPFRAFAFKAHVARCTDDSAGDTQVLQPGSPSKSCNFLLFPPVNCLNPGAQWQSTLDIYAISTLSCSLIPRKPPVKQNRSDWITLDSSQLVLSCP